MQMLGKLEFVMDRKLLTAEGYQRLQDELNHLLRHERPEITKIVSWAASLGDRSENADYHYNKRKLREIDRRIRYLSKLFEVAQKVEYHPQQQGKEILRLCRRKRLLSANVVGLCMVTPRQGINYPMKSSKPRLQLVDQRMFRGQSWRH